MTLSKPLNTITSKYLSAKRRLIILDYDGTLCSFKPTPREAKPSPALKHLLSSLAGDPANDVAILSGRDKDTLNQWFGDLHVVLGAEHGFFVKPVGKAWHATKHTQLDWKPTIRDIMAEAELPGAFIEEKAVGVVWQYRRCDQEKARKVAVKLIRELDVASEGLNLNIMHGNRVVEVLPPGANKGTAAKHWMGEHTYDFVLAAGDDRTDRDTFEALQPQPGAYSIDIGKPGIATAVVPTPTAFRDWLGSLVTA